MRAGGSLCFLVIVTIATLLGAQAAAPFGAKPIEVPPGKISGRYVVAFFEVAATADQVSGVRAFVERSHDIRRFSFTDRAAALREFQSIFAGEPDILANTTADQLPESFEIEPRDTGSRRRIVRELAELPGIDSTAVTPPVRLQRRLLARCKRSFEGRGEDDLEVFMLPDADQSAIATVRSALASSPLISDVSFLDKHAALREFKRIFSDDKEIVSSITADALPTSFRVALAPGADASSVRALAQGLAMVDSVSIYEPVTPGTLQACVALQTDSVTG